ncbi:MAG: hypothetical protein ACKOC2_00870 [Gemmatimonadota bacterium]
MRSQARSGWAVGLADEEELGIGGEDLEGLSVIDGEDLDGNLDDLDEDDLDEDEDEEFEDDDDEDDDLIDLDDEYDDFGEEDDDLRGPGRYDD